MSVACKGIRNLSSAAGTENTLKAVPHGGEAAWRKPDTSRAQRGLLAEDRCSFWFGVTWKIKLQGSVCLCLWLYSNSPPTWPQSRNGSTSGIPRGGRKGAFAFANAEKRGVLLPAEQDLLWPRGSAEIIWLSPPQFVKEVHTGSDKCSQGVFAVSQQVLVW